MAETSDRDTDMLMDEVFFKDENVKSRLFGLEKAETILYTQLSNFDTEFRFLRRFVYSVGVAVIVVLITTLIKVW